MARALNFRKYTPCQWNQNQHPSFAGRQKWLLQIRVKGRNAGYSKQQEHYMRQHRQTLTFLAPFAFELPAFVKFSVKAGWSSSEEESTTFTSTELSSSSSPEPQSTGCKMTCKSKWKNKLSEIRNNNSMSYFASRKMAAEVHNKLQLFSP